MKIESIQLKNFRCFRDFFLSLDPEMTVIVAPNGGGKTSVLEAIGVALGPYLSKIRAGVNRGIRWDDVRQEAVPGNTFDERRFTPARLEATGRLPSVLGKEKAAHWACELRGKKSKTTNGEAHDLLNLGSRLQNDVDEQRNTILPLIAYYSTARLWGTGRLTAKKLDALRSRESGYLECLDAKCHFQFTSMWFEYLEKNRQIKSSSKVSTEWNYKLMVREIQRAVDLVVGHTGWKQIEYDFTREKLVMHHKEQGTLPVTELSDGIRIMVGLAFDIAARAVRLNSHIQSGATRKTPGIVLVDEVDLHLHPAWQQTVLRSLQEAFPKIQFIVTTHSPQVLTTVPARCIRMLKQDQVTKDFSFEEPVFSLGAESAVLMDAVQGVSQRPNSVEEVQELNRYQTLVEQDKYHSPEAKILRDKLNAWAAGLDPVLTRIDMDIRMREFRKNRG